MILIIIIGVSYGIYEKTEIYDKPLKTKAYAIWPCDNNWIGKDCWEYIYFYNNQYFIRRVANTSGLAGSVDLIEINKSNPSSSKVKLTDRNIEKNKMIFFGNDFTNNDSIVFLGCGKHLKSVIVDQQFGLILELCQNTTVELYRNGQLFSIYNFCFAINNDHNFYPIQMENPKQKFEKNISIGLDGKINVEIKELN
jgi:hypothetical protein